MYRDKIKLSLVTKVVRDTPLSAKVGTSFADRRRPLCRPRPCRAVAPLDLFTKVVHH